MSVDLYQTINSTVIDGSDVQIAASGDYLTVEGAQKTRQRIMRRLFTNPGDYFWHPEFGAGIPRYVGRQLSNVDINQIKALCVSQILLESTVAKIPAPTVDINQLSLYVISITIGYTDAVTNKSEIITFNVSK